MTGWPDLEAALQARAGWRRVGHEYHGPCPVTGAGRDCCFASAAGMGLLWPRGRSLRVGMDLCLVDDNGGGAAEE